MPKAVAQSTPVMRLSHDTLVSSDKLSHQSSAPEPVAYTRHLPRRSLLVGLTSTAAVFGVLATTGERADGMQAGKLPAQGADGELIALCARLEAVQRHLNGFWLQGTGTRFFTPASYIENDNEREAASSFMEAEIESLFNQIVEINPTTLDGFRAVARCLVLNEPNLRHNGQVMIEDMDFSSTGEHVLQWLISCLSGGEITPETCMVEPGQVRL